MVLNTATRSRSTHLRLVPPERRTCPRTPDRSGEVEDPRLAAILAAEDIAEEHGMSPHVRSTCYVHQCWIHECISDPLHVLIVTGHRWCRLCDHVVEVEIDEAYPDSVELRCDGCGVPPDSIANREVLFACRTSLAAMRGGDAATLYAVPDV